MPSIFCAGISGSSRLGGSVDFGPRVLLSRCARNLNGVEPGLKRRFDKRASDFPITDQFMEEPRAFQLIGHSESNIPHLLRKMAPVNISEASNAVVESSHVQKTGLGNKYHPASKVRESKSLKKIIERGKEHFGEHAHVIEQLRRDRRRRGRIGLDGPIAVSRVIPDPSARSKHADSDSCHCTPESKSMEGLVARILDNAALYLDGFDTKSMNFCEETAYDELSNAHKHYIKWYARQIYKYVEEVLVEKPQAV